jgi:hypothetical protein
MNKIKMISEAISWRRLKALCYKETLQIIRDPSSNLVAFVLPLIMLFIFGYGINLDSGAIKIGLLVEDHSEEAHRFADSFYGSRYFSVLPAQSRQQLDQDIMDGTIRGFVVIAQNFSDDLKRPGNSAPVQVVTDGAEPQLAAFVEGYSLGAWHDWLAQRNRAQGIRAPAQIGIQERYWFNPSAESRNFLVPGSITLIMTVVGALLTSWHDGSPAGFATDAHRDFALQINSLLCLGHHLTVDLRGGRRIRDRRALSRLDFRALSGFNALSSHHLGRGVVDLYAHEKSIQCCASGAQSRLFAVDDVFRFYL